MSSLSQNVLTLLVKYFFWSLLCSKYKYTHTHTDTEGVLSGSAEAKFPLLVVF